MSNFPVFRAENIGPGEWVVVSMEDFRKLEAVAEAMDVIRCSSSSVPLGMEPADFYRAQMLKSIGTAARALAALEETP